MSPALRIDLFEFLRREAHHYECEDCWYSCATITCDERRKGGSCDCGANEALSLLNRLQADKYE